MRDYRLALRKPMVITYKPPTGEKLKEIQEQLLALESCGRHLILPTEEDMDFTQYSPKSQRKQTRITYAR